MMGHLEVMEIDHKGIPLKGTHLIVMPLVSHLMMALHQVMVGHLTMVNHLVITPEIEISLMMMKALLMDPKDLKE